MSGPIRIIYFYFTRFILIGVDYLHNFLCSMFILATYLPTYQLKMHRPEGTLDGPQQTCDATHATCTSLQRQSNTPARQSQSPPVVLHQKHPGSLPLRAKARWKVSGPRRAHSGAEKLLPPTLVEGCLVSAYCLSYA
jgi:hypothetical protein